MSRWDQTPTQKRENVPDAADDDEDAAPIAANHEDDAADDEEVNADESTPPPPTTSTPVPDGADEIRGARRFTLKGNCTAHPPAPKPPTFAASMIHPNLRLQHLTAQQFHPGSAPVSLPTDGGICDALDVATMDLPPFRDPCLLASV